MGSITNQQYAAGEFGDGHNLADHAFITNDWLAFIYAVNAALINNHLIAVRIVNGGNDLGHHLLLVLAQRRTQQFTQTRVFLTVLTK